MRNETAPRTDADLIALHARALKGNAQDYHDGVIPHETFTARNEALWAAAPRHVREQIAEAVSRPAMPFRFPESEKDIAEAGLCRHCLTL